MPPLPVYLSVMKWKKKNEKEELKSVTKDQTKKFGTDLETENGSCRAKQINVHYHNFERNCLKSFLLHYHHCNLRSITPSYALRN